MKNKELIKILKGFSPDAHVTTSRSEDICIGYLLEDKMTIFIDPADTCPSCLFYKDGYCTEHECECFNVDGCDCYIEME